MKLAQDITKADLEEMGFVQETKVRYSKGRVSLALRVGHDTQGLRPGNVELTVYGPHERLLWTVTFTGETPATVVLASVKLAYSITVAATLLEEVGEDS